MTDQSKPIQVYPAKSSSWTEIVTRMKENQDKIIADLREKGEDPVVHHICITFSEDT
jgi:hypothetical protein